MTEPEAYRLLQKQAMNESRKLAQYRGRICGGA